MASRAEELSVELVWRPARDMPTLMFDPEALHRAILNVVTNAIDACDEKEDGRVIVTPATTTRAKLAQIVDRGQRRGHRPRRPRGDLHRVRLAQGRPRHGPGPAGDAQDSRRARRPGSRRQHASARAAASRSTCRRRRRRPRATPSSARRRRSRRPICRATRRRRRRRCQRRPRADHLIARRPLWRSAGREVAAFSGDFTLARRLRVGDCVTRRLLAGR